jgi:predicted CoA-substrate-specific enzyme activase
MRFLGLDAGSVSVKLVALSETGEKLRAEYVKHRGHPLKTALALLEGEPHRPINGEDTVLSITGSAGRLIANILGLVPLNEVVAQAFAARTLYPHIKSIIELGGEDSKLILLNDTGIEDFSMNSVCAAGTGSFLDQQAERLLLTIEEFSEKALLSESPPRIAGRCSVFAKSDMIHLQQIATPVEDIVAGLCFAVARNFRGSIMRGRSLKEPVSFHGGVAANKGMVRAFKEVLELQDLFIPQDFALMGAWGAALKLKDSYKGEKRRGFDLKKLEDFLLKEKAFEGGHKPLLINGDRFRERHMNIKHPLKTPGKKKRTYLGIDVGSISTNLALVDDDGNVIAKRYLMTSGRPIEAVMQGLREINAEVGELVEIAGAGTTGSGRYMIADYVGADIVKNEITAQATAAAFIDPRVDTIFEIGGQDSKYISLRDGVIVDFEMNKACAAGTGSFLEEQADKLNINIKDEFASLAFSSPCPRRLGERCTVFMENSLMANLGKGAQKDDLLAGLAYSIVQNYINRVVAGKPVGERIFFQGGVAFNKSVVAAFEKFLGKEITVPPHHDVTGAIGMALIAKKYMDATQKKTTFKGFSLSERKYQLSSFKCKGCPNVCEINRVRIDGEKNYLHYGGRCEKYDIRRRPTEIPNLFAWREEALWKAHNEYQRSNPEDKKPVIGIPYIFFFHDQLPFWSTLLWECGFQVEVSPRTNRQIVNEGVESVLSEGCFPVKVAHGHIKYLKEKDVNAIFLPSFMNLNAPGSEFPTGHACPHTQTIPYVVNIAIKGLKLSSPPLDSSRGDEYLVKTLKNHLKEFHLSRKKIKDALIRAKKAQAEFENAVKAKGKEVLSSLKERAIVIVGRAYNGFDKGINLEIPEKLATLGVLAIPFDFLPLENIKIYEDCPQMYWRSGQNILRIANYLNEDSRLYPIFIGNFLCGPDSFILKYFKRVLSAAEKPFLHIEIDEHSADAGAITRCEAFLDSIEGQKKTRQAAQTEKRIEAPSVHKRNGKIKIIYLPRMTDHAFGIQAAFELAGTKAEVLPPSDSKTLELGQRFVSGKECYPFLTTTGDMLRKVYEPGFEPKGTAFFMPSGTGPCRFGQYNVFHKQVLDSIGLKEVEVFAPNQDATFYRDLGAAGKDFAVNAWKGVVAYEMLQKCLHETRPYEAEPGSADKLYEKYLKAIYQALTGRNGKVEHVLAQVSRDFKTLPRINGKKKPLIGVIGEIYVRSNKFSNEDLIRKVEALGGQAWLAPMEEWIYYVNLMGLQKAWRKREKAALVDSLIKRYVQTKIEHKYARDFEFLHTLHEPTTFEILDHAAPYIHRSFEGETILSIGKAVDLCRKGAAGLINAMPFGCMPGTIVTALLRGVSRDYGVPAINIPYDGTESPAIMLQLEAFMDQARARAEGKLKL